MEQVVVGVLGEWGVRARASWVARLRGWNRVDVVVDRMPPAGAAWALAQRLGVRECVMGRTWNAPGVVMVGCPVSSQDGDYGK